MTNSDNTRHILVHCRPNDNLETVVDSAMAIINGYDSLITFAYVEADANKQSKSIKDKLQQIVAQRRLPADKIQYIVKEGKSYTEIPNIARSQKTDTIVMHVDPKSGGLVSFLSGNNPYEAVIKAPCPVVTLSGNTKLKQVKHILLPIDSTERTRQKLPVAINIAKHFGATIHMLAVSDDKTGEFKNKMVHYAEQSKKFIEDKGIVTTYDIVLGKNICDTVLEYETKSKADLIIVTADEETSMLFESCFEKVIRKSAIPVMSVQARDLKVSWAGL